MLHQNNLATPISAPLKRSPVDDLVTRCVYEIATGKLNPGDRLPPIRQAAKDWGVDRRIVIRAFAELERLGLVTPVNRSGHYISTGPQCKRIAKHRHELDRALAQLEKQLQEQTTLSLVGALRYMTQLAEQREHETPSVAFVECTHDQAAWHAAEVSRQLNFPCAPLHLEDVTESVQRIPKSVKTLLVTGFHYADLRALKGIDSLQICKVTIRIRRDANLGIFEHRGPVIVVEYDDAEARNIVKDLAKVDPEAEIHARVVASANDEMDAVIEEAPRNACIALAPRVWGELEDSWRDHLALTPIRFSIPDNSMSQIADAVGLPLGACPG